MVKNMRLKKKTISPTVQPPSNSILSIPLVTTWSLCITQVRTEPTWSSRTNSPENGSSPSPRCSLTRQCSALSLTFSKILLAISGRSSSLGHNQFYILLENSLKMSLKLTRQMLVLRVLEHIGMVLITGVVFQICSWMIPTIMTTYGFPRDNWMSISHVSIILFS